MKHGCNCKYTKRMAVVMGILLLGMGIFFSQADAIECGDTLAKGHYKLTEDLTCSHDDGAPALTLEGGANLDLNGYTVDCNDTDRNGIVLEGRNARVRNGIIVNCVTGVEITGDGHHEVLQMIVENSTREGIRVRSSYNQLIKIEARNNETRGFRIEGDDNNLVNCLAGSNDRHGFQIDGGSANKIGNSTAFHNGRQGFLIDGGSDNKISNSSALNSCRDGIEIDNLGSDNSLINNYVTDNGNSSTCEDFGEEYNPRSYAGIDITAGAQDNIVVNNRTSGNQGCNGVDCVARDRNLWDENVEGEGNCDSTNRWINNRVNGEREEPECGQIL